MQTGNNWNSFDALGQFILSRLKGPAGHFSFWVYLVLAVAGFGAFGVCAVLYDVRSETWELKSLFSALYTYFPAIAMASAFDLILPDNRKYVRSFAIAAAVLCFLLALFTATLNSDNLRMLCGLLGCGVALFLWWIANGENPNLRDLPPSNASTGGSTTAAPAGDLSNFRS
jgi:hypothetical protein